MNGTRFAPQRLWGEAGDARGQRFEQVAREVLLEWLSAYNNDRAWGTLEIEELWSDRMYAGAAKIVAWKSLCEDLGIPPDCGELRECDILFRFTWTSDASAEPSSLLVVGEVSTDMNQKRQGKVAAQYRVLRDAEHTVLPIQFGLPHRQLIDPPPHLAKVEIPDEDAISSYRTLRDATRTVRPATLGSAIDTLIGKAGQQA